MGFFLSEKRPTCGTVGFRWWTKSPHQLPRCYTAVEEGQSPGLLPLCGWSVWIHMVSICFVYGIWQMLLSKVSNKKLFLKDYKPVK